MEKYKRNKTSIIFVGDVMIARRYSFFVNKYGYKYPFKHVKHKLKSADIRFCNLEGPLSDRGERARKKYAFKTPLKMAKALKDGGFDVVSLANNHILDYGPDALEDTLKALNKLYIEGVGLNFGNKTWRDIPIYSSKIIEKNETKFGFLAYSKIIPRGFLSTNDIPGIMSAEDTQAIKDDIEKIRGKTDFVIVSMHWGREYLKDKSTKEQRKIARTLIKSGADIVIGHHPHVVERIEKYQDGLIFYSLGNFVFDQKESMHKHVTESIMAEVIFENKKISRYKITPIKIKNFRPTISGNSRTHFM